MTRGRSRKQRGNAIVEFALVATFLVPLVAGTFTVGLALLRAQQVLQVNRDMGALYVKGVPMYTTSAKALAVRLSDGLGLGPSYRQYALDNPSVTTTPADSSFQPSATGNGVIYISQVLHVGELDCAQGGFVAPSYTGCTNFDKYVFMERTAMGNTSLRASDMGTPTGPFDSTNKISVNDYLTKTGNVATGFKTSSGGSGIIWLEKSSYTKASESFFKLDELAFLINLDLTVTDQNTYYKGVYVRNLY